MGCVRGHEATSVAHTYRHAMLPPVRLASRPPLSKAYCGLRPTQLRLTYSDGRGVNTVMSKSHSIRTVDCSAKRVSVGTRI